MLTVCQSISTCCQSELNGYRPPFQNKIDVQCIHEMIIDFRVFTILRADVWTAVGRLKLTIAQTCLFDHLQIVALI